MSVRRAEAVVYARLAGNHTLRRLCAERIWPDQPDRDQPGPLLVYSRVGTVPAPTLNSGDSGIRGVLVDVEARAPTKRVLNDELVPAIEEALDLHQELPQVAGIFLEDDQVEEVEHGFKRRQTYRVMIDETG